MRPLQSYFRQHETYVVLIVILFCIIITSINPVFFTLENLFDLLKSSVGRAILAIGIFIVLLSGGIDVSSTAIAICGQYIAINTIIAFNVDSIVLCFLISITVGVAFGAINALLISVFNIPTLIATLGTSSVFHGALLEFVGTKSVNTGDLPESVKEFSRITLFSLTRDDGSIYGPSLFIIILIFVVLISYLILRYTIIGRGIYAIGGNREAARRIGYNITAIQFFIYCYAGFLAGIVGILHLSLIRYSNPNYLVGTELGVIAAVVLGGTRISGGTGSLRGTLLGVALITILEKNLVLIGLSSYWQQFFIGLVIVVSVSITHLRHRISHRSLLLRGGG